MKTQQTDRRARSTMPSTASPRDKKPKTQVGFRLSRFLATRPISALCTPARLPGGRFPFLGGLGVGLFILAASLVPLRADIIIRVSVKHILKPDGTRPAPGDIGTAAGFAAEIMRGNGILAATGRGFQLQVVESLDIQPPPPTGQPVDFWFNIDARSKRREIEAAAVADQATWAWNANSINVFVNNSSSGQCSFPGSGLSISLGNNIATGTVLHEFGHFFNLRHTHSAADNDGDLDDWGNGDSLSETLDDDPDASRADIDARYPNESQLRRDNLFFNVMSYHQEDRLLTGQMDVWTGAANDTRDGFCTARTWFVAASGSDLVFGSTASAPLKTIAGAFNRTENGDDVILLRHGTYSAPNGGTLSTPCTLRATRGDVDIFR